MTIRKGMALVIATLTTMGLWAEGALNHAWTEVAKDVTSYTHNPNGIVYANNIFGFTEKVTFAEGSVNNAIIFKMPGEVKTINLETTAEGKYKLTVQHGNGDANTIVQTSEKTATAGEHRYSVFVRRGPEGGGQCVGAAIVWCDGEELFKVQESKRNYGTGPLRRIEFGNTTGNTISAEIWTAVDAINGQYTATTDDTKIAEIEADSKMLFATDNVVTGEAEGDVDFSKIAWSKTIEATSSVKLTLTGDATITLDQTKPLKVEVVKAEGIESAELNLVAKNALWFPNSLGEGVSYGVATISDETDEAVSNAAITVPSDCTLFINGRAKSTDDPLKIKGLITIPSGSKLVTAGEVKITPHDETPTTNNTSGSVINADATMEVLDGTTAMKFADRGLKGTLTIDANATLKPIDFVDACNYDGSSEVNVYGTLDMSDSWARWTLRQNNVMNFYYGCYVKGDGQSGSNSGAIQFNTTGCVLHFKNDPARETKGGEMFFDAKLHAQQPFTVDVEESLSVIMRNGLGTSKEPMTVTGNNSGVILTKLYEFNKPVTVGENATLVLKDEGDVSNGVKGEGALVFETKTELSLGAYYRAPLKVSFSGDDLPTISVLATDEEMTAGEITFKVEDIWDPEECAWSVTKADGQEVPFEITSETDEESNVIITLKLGTKTYTESTATADWTDFAGRVTVMGPSEAEAEAIVMTFNAELPEAVTEVYLGGKVVITAAADAKLPSGKFHFLEGADVTVSNDLRAGETTVTPGATLRLRDVVLTKDIVVQGGATVIVEGAVTTPKIALAASNATLTVEPNAVLTVSANQAFSKANRGQGTFNIYGTIALGEYNWNHNFNNNTINCYAGGAITGTTGQFICGGGSGTTYNLKNYLDSTERAFTFDVIMGEDFGDYPDTYACEANVGLKILKNNNRTSVCTISGTNINGLELAYGTFKISANNRCLRGAVKIAPGAKLTLDTIADIINYGSGVANPATFDIAGTLQCDARQTIFDANTFTLRDGAQITGTGGEHQSLMRAFDVCRDLSIAVEGTATMSAPFVFRDKRTITVDGTATSKLVLESVGGNDQGVFKLTGGKLQLPIAVAEARVTTDVAGKMVKIAESTETSKTYRLAPKSFTISIQ